MIRSCDNCFGQGIKPNPLKAGIIPCPVCEGKCFRPSKFFAKGDVIIWRKSHLGVIVDDYSMTVKFTVVTAIVKKEDIVVIGNIERDPELRQLSLALDLIQGKIPE